jgi:signal peptidase I
VYTRQSGDPRSSFQIARKPPHKLTAMLQIVDDSAHIPQLLKDKQWPPRWREMTSDANPAVAWKSTDGGSSFACEQVPAGMAWLRYRHLVPSYQDWETLTLGGKLPDDVHERRGQLITDMYAYNTSIYVGSGSLPPPGDYELMGRHSDPNVIPERLRGRIYTPYKQEVRYDPSLAGPGVPCSEADLGRHWVDDIALECLAEIQDAQGNLALDLVRAGVHYRCTIDVQTGQAKLSRTNAAGNALPFITPDGKEHPTPTAATPVKGAGMYRLRLTNCDHEVMLFVNGRAVAFDQPALYESDEVVAPQWTKQDGLDLEPAGVGVSGLRAKVSQLRIFRDKYYIADTNGFDYDMPPMDRLSTIFSTPELWQSSQLFEVSKRAWSEYGIGPNEFFPMGDNSPSSSDGRYWPETDTLHRDLLIGKALVIYWPHAWNRPVPIMPNVGRMGLIK